MNVIMNIQNPNISCALRCSLRGNIVLDTTSSTTVQLDAFSYTLASAPPMTSPSEALISNTDLTELSSSSSIDNTEGETNLFVFIRIFRLV